MSEFGIKYDRELALVPVNFETDSLGKMSLKFWVWPPMMRLRQTLKGSVVTVTTTHPELLAAKGLPLSLDIDLSQAPEDVGPLIDRVDKANLHITSGFVGHRYDSHLSHWFSTIVEKEVYLMRAQNKKRPARIGNLPLKKANDLVKSYVCESPIHLVNECSVRML